MHFRQERVCGSVHSFTWEITDIKPCVGEDILWIFTNTLSFRKIYYN